MKLKALGCIALAFLPFVGAHAQEDTIRIGVIAALTGPFVNIGKPFEDGIRTYMQQYGDKVAGKKIEILYRDDGGSNVELSKRAAQELIGREKVSFLIGFSLTPSALAVAPVATQGKVPMIVMNAVTTGITAKSPYMLRTSMSMQQMTEPFGDWTAKNKIGKVYSLVTDYSTGVDAEARFTKGLAAGGGKIVGSARVPLANPIILPSSSASRTRSRTPCSSSRPASRTAPACSRLSATRAWTRPASASSASAT